MATKLTLADDRLDAKFEIEPISQGAAFFRLEHDGEKCSVGLSADEIRVVALFLAQVLEAS